MGELTTAKILQHFSLDKNHIKKHSQSNYKFKHESFIGNNSSIVLKKYSYS